MEKQILDLKAERAQLDTYFEEISKRSDLSQEDKDIFEQKESRAQQIDEEIQKMEKQLLENKKNVKMENTNEKRNLAVEFREFLQKSIEGGVTSFRADPIITSTDADLIQKSTLGIDVLKTPGETFLRNLGVTFYENLNGNLALPSMDEDLATFPGEDASAASANMLPDSNVLAARRVTHTQSITRETLAQTSPQVYQTILQALQDGIWKAIVYDLFDQIDTDAATQISTMGTTLTYNDMVNMEASIGGLEIGSAAYVTGPTGKAFLKKTLEYGTTAGDVIWKDNEINGYPAFSSPGANANKVYFGDWARAAVATFGNGGIEIIVDPYSNAKKGLINLTAVALVDTGVQNKRAFCIKDGSFA